MAATPKELPTPVVSEDLLSAKTDICLSNALVKGSIGFGAGVVASAILFRRRPWPVLMGLGFGLGQGYSDCERVFNPAAIPGFKIAGEPTSSPYTLKNPFTTSTTPPPAASAAAAKVEAKAASLKPQVEAKVEKAKVDVQSVKSDLKAKAEELVEKGKAKAVELKEQAVGVKEEAKAELKKTDKKWV